MSSSDRTPYETATVLDQSFLDFSQDNLTNKLRMIVTIETPTGTIHASDQNFFVGSTFYEALLTLPTIQRTLGEWLSNQLEFSTLNLEFSNVDGRFNKFLPAGNDFSGWIGKEVQVKIGLRDVESTYFTIYKGKVTDIGGLERSTKSIIIISRDTFDRLSVDFPSEIFDISEFPKIGDNVQGLTKPIIYGDWTDPSTLTDRTASVPAFLVNGADPFLQIDKTNVVELSISSPGVATLTGHNFDADDPIKFDTTLNLPTGIIAGTTYYAQPINVNTFNISATPGGSLINFTGFEDGEHTVQPSTTSYENLQFEISANINQSFDTTKVYIFRGNVRYLVDSSDITNVNAHNNYFEIIQNTGNTKIGPDNFIFQDNDQYYVRVIGEDLGATYNDNIVEQARDILTLYGGLTVSDFHANWDTFRNKSTPAENAISSIKSRAWIQETQPVIDYALSMLEQVRLEAFIDRDQTIKLSSLHFDDWESSPSHTLRNWDIEKNSLVPKLDVRNNFNRANGNFNFSPDKGNNNRYTAFFKNENAITQAEKTISKTIVFPNLYLNSDVENQLKEVLKLSSSYLEVIDVNLTWRTLLKDLGEFVKLNINFGSTEFTDVPAMIRNLNYDPNGFKLPTKLWSLQMVPFPGYTPGYSGTVGGYNATIIQE